MASEAILRAPEGGRSLRSVVSWAGWTGVVLLGIFFFVTTVPNYFHFDSAHYHYYWPARWWLVAHVGGGSLALWLGPMQFSGALRRRFVRVHRWMGRVYLGGVLVGAVGAIYMGFAVSPSKGFGIALESALLSPLPW